MLWLIFYLFSGCALHSNIGVFESNQPTIQIGMDILPETIYDVLEEIEEAPTDNEHYQNVSYPYKDVSYGSLQRNPTSSKFMSRNYKGWGSQSMIVFEKDYTLLGFGSHRSYWFPLHNKLWVTSRLGIQLAQLKLESDQISINFCSPYSDFGLTYLQSNTTAFSIKGSVQSNLFLISQKNNINYGVLFGISKGILPSSKR